MSFKKIYHSLVLISGIILLGILLLLNFIYPLTLGKMNILYSDFGKFYYSQQLFIQGKNIYSPIYFVKNKSSISSIHTTNVKSTHSKVLKLGGNLNPPFFTLLSFPLGYLSYPHALLCWTVLSIVAGALGILILQQTLDPQAFSLSSALLLLLGLFSYFPSFVNLQFGQTSLLLLPLLIYGWRAARQKKTINAAIYLAIASSLKPFMGLFLFYFLMRKEWYGLCAFLLTLFSGALITTLFLGFDSYVAYYHTCQQIKWAASSWNVSIYGFLLRFFGGGENNIALLPVSGLIIFLYPLIIGILFVAILQFLRPALTIPAEQKVDLDFSVVITAMLLLSPLGWLYYFPLLSIPLLTLWHTAKTGIYSIVLPIGLMTCIFFSNIPISLFDSDQIHTANVFRVFFGSSLYFLVLLGLTGLLFFLRYRLINKNLNIQHTHFERIPPGLLLLIGIVVFLPSYQGISKATIDWILHSTHYSQEYSPVAHH